jgi:hypothetical protein
LKTRAIKHKNSYSDQHTTDKLDADVDDVLKDNYDRKHLAALANTLGLAPGKKNMLIILANIISAGYITNKNPVKEFKNLSRQLRELGIID